MQQETSIHIHSMERLSLNRPILVGLMLVAILFSACAMEKITPRETAQATSRSTSLPASQIYGNLAITGSPTITPVDEPTTAPTITPMDEPTSEVVTTSIAQLTTATPDVVHLGVPWADFSLRFDPLQWEISPFDDDQPDLQSLTHRTLANCRITPNTPVGLGEGWTIEVKHITLGQLELKARSFYQSGMLKFVGYYNFLNPYGDGAVEVHFIDNSDACIQAAEALFAATEVILP